MFAGFQIDAGVEAQKVDADVKIASQFASGKAATAVARPAGRRQDHQDRPADCPDVRR